MQIILFPIFVIDYRKTGKEKINNISLILLLISMGQDGKTNYLTMETKDMESRNQKSKEAGDYCKKVIEEISKGSKAEQTPLNTLPYNWITTLFARFQFSWPNVFASKYPTQEMLENAKKEWAESLYGIPPEAIKRALDESKRIYDFPPSISQFLALCNKRQEAAYMPVWDRLSLPDKVSSPESKQAAEKAREEIRNKLGLKSK